MRVPCHLYCTHVAQRTMSKKRLCPSVQGSQLSLFDSWSTAKRAELENQGSSSEICSINSHEIPPGYEPEELAQALEGQTSDLDSTTCESSNACSQETLCQSMCCSCEKEAFQPSNRDVLKVFSSNGRNFMPAWYKDYPWLTLCSTTLG